MSSNACLQNDAAESGLNRALTLPDLLAQTKIISVLEILDEFDAVPIVDCLGEGGLKTVEITLRTAAALDSISIVKKRAPDIIVGAGTVQNSHDLQAAIDAGADFVVSPGNTEKLLETALKAEIPYMPGAANASDIIRASEYGFKLVKFFPATLLGGVKMLKSLSRPFYNTLFCPTGGITEDNLHDYLELPNVLCVGGSWIVRSHDIYGRRWEKIVERAKFASTLCY